MIIKENIKLDNGVTILLIDDKIINNEFNFNIIFKNNGYLNDKEYSIPGFHHLLEHLIFESYTDVSDKLLNNAMTNSNQMILQVLINKKNYKYVLDTIKKWIFYDKNFTKINFFNKINNDNVQNLINILECEYLFRTDANKFFYWLDYFLISNGDSYYVGGNIETLNKKKSDLIKLINNFKINSKDIVITLSRSCYFLLPEIKNLFKHIIYEEKKVYDNSIDLEKFNNKIINIGNGPFIVMYCTISDNMEKIIYLIITLLYQINIIPLNNKRIFLFIPFLSIEDFYQFCFFMKIKHFDKVLQIYSNDLLITYLDIQNIVDYEEILTIDPTIVYKSKYKIYNQFKNEISFFFNSISDEIIKNNIILHGPKTVIYNNITTIGKERYLLNELNIDENYFFSLYKNYNIETTNNYYNNNSNKCFFNIDKIHLNNYTPSTAEKYMKSIVFFYLTNCFNIFEDYLSIFKEYNIYYIDDFLNNISDIKINTKTINIKSELDYIFFIYKTKNDHEDITHNFYHKLRSKGYTYYVAKCILKINKNNFIFIMVISNKMFHQKILNIFKSLYLSYNINISYLTILSEKSVFGDYDQINKNIIINI